MGQGNKKIFKTNGHGHVTKMAAMPIYGKNPLKIFSETNKPLTLVHVYSNADSGPTKFVQMMILGWPWSFYSKVKFAS